MLLTDNNSCTPYSARRTNGNMDGYDDAARTSWYPATEVPRIVPRDKHASGGQKTPTLLLRTYTLRGVGVF